MYFSRRLPHVITKRHLVMLLAPTYAKARSVDEGEASERLERALAVPAVIDDLHRGISAALSDAKGPRTAEDALMDRLSARIDVGSARAKPAEETPGLAAVLVRLDLEIGLAPEAMRATLATERGRALLEAGLREIGAHFVKQLLRQRGR